MGKKGEVALTGKKNPRDSPSSIHFLGPSSEIIGLEIAQNAKSYSKRKKLLEGRTFVRNMKICQKKMCRTACEQPNLTS